MRPRRGDSTRPLDLGWLFLLPGIALLAAGVLIAAEDDVYEARFHRDQALAIERRHAERVDRYRTYLEALQRQDPTVVRSLVVSQLNAAPTDLVEERVPGAPVYDATEVFSALEPDPAEPAQRIRVDSVLARWATRNESRMWLLASGALCVFVGLLPPASRRRGGVGIAGQEMEDAGAGVGLKEADEALEPGEAEDAWGGDDGEDAEDSADLAEDPEAEEAFEDDPADEPEDALEAEDEEADDQEEDAEEWEEESEEDAAGVGALDAPETDEEVEEDGFDELVEDADEPDPLESAELDVRHGEAAAMEAEDASDDAGVEASDAEESGGPTPGLFDTLPDGSSGPRA